MAPRRDKASSTTRPSSASRGRAASLPASDVSSRIVFILLIFFVVVVAFVVRLVYLQVAVADEYATDARDARTTVIDTSPRRGTIYDRNGIVLATSVDAVTVYANPQEVTDANGVAAQLAYVLGGDYESYRQSLSQQDATFVYIKRKADADVEGRIEQLGLKGVYCLPDTKRVYPNNQIGGQVIGFTDIDGNGIAGLELYYDDILRGSPGKLVVERGVGGIPIPGGVHMETQAVNGQDIIVSLDIGLQQYVEERLLQGVEAVEGKGGNAVVMDASNGEILAAASLPLFNPSDTSVVEEGATQLKSVTEAFEPGSIFKTATMLAVLESGTLKPDDTFVYPAYLDADGYRVTDAHPRGDEAMSLTQILARSSNVGMSLVAEKLGFPQLYQSILDYNLDSPTGVDYPGESGGYLLAQSKWSLIQSYNVSFGQGITTTPLQMVRFYGALVNDGVECTPHFLIKKPQSDEEVHYESVDVVKNKAAIGPLTDMLEAVVTEGTATDIAIDGYDVAGKTGTAEIASEEGGYKAGLYNISFIGFLPHTDSQLVCFVGATEVPGDRKVTQVFQDIMTFAIDRYRIVPSEG